MKKASSHTLLLLFFWLLNTSAHLCSYDQSHALIDFKNNFTIDSYASYYCSLSHPRTNSWSQGQDCCYWDGVTCDTTTGHVIGLDLSCSELQGQLSSSNSLFLLQHLQILNLAFNDFTGSEISARFGQLQRLTHLNLSSCLFSGEVPIEISYIYNLVSLDLSGADYLRVTRVVMTSLVQNLTNLRELHLDNVDLSYVGAGSLMNLTSSSLTSLVLSGLNGIFSTSILHLPNLEVLRLSNFIKGDLQVYLPASNWSTTSLMELEFSYIVLKTGLPSSIGNLKSLKSLSISGCGISGSIPDSIGNLTTLEHLDFSYNNLVGSIPLYMYSFPLLRVLDLFNNQLTGGQLRRFQSGVLQTVDLQGCGLQGPIPTLLFPHGANQLIRLDLSHNSLNGTIPPSLFTPPSLLYVFLGHNQLVGRIPEFISTSLKQIYLSNNKLQGNIPSSIFGLADLIIVHFASNNLSGTIETDMLSKLQSLIDLDGSNNSLSFSTSLNLNQSLPNLQYFYFPSNNLTEFPTFLQGSKNLFSLDLSNNKINGHVPDWLWGIGRDTLNYLNLAHNNLTRIDKLPWMILKYLDLRSNLLQGPLPLPPSTLVTYFISNNSLTGDIPALICNMSFMEAFDLSRNYFTGTIPECLGNIFTLTVLDLSTNRFHGKIPNFSAHNKRSLQTINLNGNQLEGKLPISLVNCKKLEVLDIGKNAINDTFPHWLRLLTELQVLVLKSNNFHGYIHDYKYPHSFQKLRIFDVSNNNFVGSLPTKYIQDLEAMKKDMLVGINNTKYMDSYSGGSLGSYYQDSISLTIKGSEIHVEKILTTFMTIDFSKNNFGGEIPQVIGALLSLKSLNLSHNNLVGNIPASIGNLRSLESLDLSSNKVSGRIPRELASVTFLGKLNLSQNALVGPIPNTNNFDTRFDNSSYQENLELCGPPLSRTCSNKNNKKPPPTLHEEKGSGDFDRMIILYGYISGLVIGLSIGYMVFSGELPIWLVNMIERYQQRELKTQIQRSRGRN